MALPKVKTQYSGIVVVGRGRRPIEHLSLTRNVQIFASGQTCVVGATKEIGGQPHRWCRALRFRFWRRNHWASSHQRTTGASFWICAPDSDHYKHPNGGRGNAGVCRDDSFGTIRRNGESILDNQLVSGQTSFGIGSGNDIGHI